MLAVFLTYSAIVSTYVPFVVEGFRERARAEADSTARADSLARTAATGLDTAVAVSAEPRLIGALYVHEMGHVAALRRLGIKADAPMFIPGLPPGAGGIRGAHARARRAHDARGAGRRAARPLTGVGAILG